MTLAVNGGLIGCGAMRPIEEPRDLSDCSGYHDEETPLRDAAQANPGASLAVGRDFLCAISSWHNVLCIGQGINLAAPQQDRPQVVLGVTGAVGLSAGPGNNICARMVDGRVLCWGTDHRGYYGTHGATPREVRELEYPRRVDTGPDETCAVVSSGAVLCWGATTMEGQGCHYGVGLPAEVAGVTGAIDVAVGEDFVCALTRTGNVLCWGSNRDRETGHESSECRSTPSAVPGVRYAVALEVGGRHACALLSSGHVQCWGRNEQGQVTGGRASEREGPTEVPGVTDGRALALGTRSSCVLRSTGQVVCWGSGRLGDGLLSEANPPVEVEGIMDATEISAGDLLMCARSGSDRVLCWGHDLSDALHLERDPDALIRPVEIVGLLTADRELAPSRR